MPRHPQRDPNQPTAAPPLSRPDPTASPDAFFSRQVYRGAWAYGQRHGEGRSERRDGSSYEGQWAHGRPLGRGTLLEPAAGRRYVGGVAGGARSGLGTLRLEVRGPEGEPEGGGSEGGPEGGVLRHDEVEGEWVGDKLADGVYRWADGAEYDGELDDALRPHGRGGYVGVGGERYDGDFARGVRAGRGVSRLPGGDEYEGGWAGDARHGRGTLRLAGGGSYEGCFEAGRRGGQGLALHADGSSYEGQWVDDIPHGVGSHYYTPGAEGADMYGGHWAQGLPHGHGVYCYAGGASFDGEHAEGLRHGAGKPRPLAPPLHPSRAHLHPSPATLLSFAPPCTLHTPCNPLYRLTYPCCERIYSLILPHTPVQPLTNPNGRRVQASCSSAPAWWWSPRGS